MILQWMEIIFHLIYQKLVSRAVMIDLISRAVIIVTVNQNSYLFLKFHHMKLIADCTNAMSLPTSDTSLNTSVDELSLFFLENQFCCLVCLTHM